VASYRFAWRPRWVAGHVLVLAAVVTMVLLGRWQLLVSDRKHFSLQNFGYALQWWAFSIFAVLFWVKILRDQAIGRRLPPAEQAEQRSDPAPEITYRRYVMPTRGADTDPEVERYNAYLAALAERDEK
jgi:DNA-binding transcriptional regulator of glucitol operon